MSSGQSRSYPNTPRKGRAGPRFTRASDEPCGFTFHHLPGNEDHVTMRQLIDMLTAMRTKSVRLIVCGVLETPYIFGNTTFAADCWLCAPTVVSREQALGILTSTLLTGYNKTAQERGQTGPRTDPAPELSDITEYEWRTVATVYVEEI